jgi:hypothetical protein
MVDRGDDGDDDDEDDDDAILKLRGQDFPGVPLDQRMTFKTVRGFSRGHGQRRHDSDCFKVVSMRLG